MREEIIVSGRNNPLIDPHLAIWEWQIPSYLFLGGLAAGILFFAGLYTVLKKEKEFKAAVGIAPLVTPVLLVLGLFFLFLDLKHKLYFWQLYTTINLESPMSWGAWVLMIIAPVSIIWSAIHIKNAFPFWDWKFTILKDLEAFFLKHKTELAWIMMISSVVLGIYTGILLSAFNARPLWNTSILGPLFLTSGLSTGAAAIILLSKSHAERLAFAKIDLMLIAIEIFLIVHMLMGFRASTQVQIEASRLFLGGEFTTVFWVFVVALGLVIPALLEVFELKHRKVPYLVAPVLVLVGGLVFRFIMVHAGQVSRWLY